MAEFRTTWGARLMAAFIAASAIGEWLFDRTWAQGLFTCAMLLIA